MEQIVVTKPSGTQINLFSRDPLVTVVEAKQIKKLLSDDVLNITVDSVTPLDLEIGDKILMFGDEYVLNLIPTATRTMERRFRYVLTFEGVQYEMIRALYFNTDISGFNTGTEFSLTGNLDMFVNVLMNNLTRVFGAGKWIKGTVQSTGDTTLTFNNENCLAVLQRLCQEFDTEFEIIRAANGTRTLHLRKGGQVLGHTYKYGRIAGLYELSRSTVSEKEFITRLYAFGSEKNLPSNYRNYSGRLRMSTTGSYIENATAKAAFGLKEGVVNFEDVYPHRTGTVTSVSGDGLSFVDSGMDFDLFASSGGNTTYLMSGVTAKVHFNSGNLAGYEFEVSKYVHATKTFTLVPTDSNKGQEMPQASGAFSIAAGDKYVIVDIVMPQSYVDAAEAELQAKATEFLNNNSAPRVQYTLKVDEMYLLNLGFGTGTIANVFNLGDTVQILDAELDVNKGSRITEFTRNVIRPYQYELTIADSYDVTLIERILDEQSQINSIIKVNNLRSGKAARQAWRNAQELYSMTFDPEGHYYSEKIKPLSIETEMLSVGAKSQQFQLDITFEANYQGNPNVVRSSAGTLTHLTIDDSAIRVWQIAALTQTLGDSSSYYIYAVADRTNFNVCNISYSKAQYVVDADARYWIFLIGVLHSVDSGTNTRAISLTYGFTTINGRYIKTGRIQSADGYTYFDLDMNEIGGNIKFRATDGGLKEVSDLDDFVDASINDLQTQVDGKIESYFQSSDPNNWPAGDRAKHNGDMWYNTSTKVLYRYNGGSNSWQKIEDQDAVAAYALASTAQDTADGKRRVFTGTPYAPYDPGDLWVNGTDLRVSIAAKAEGQVFDPNNWVYGTNYDNTVTRINGGIVTSGTIQLAGSGGSILAGITGEGTADGSVRIWAGAAYENRGTAPFRVLQSGEAFVRKRIELQDDAGNGLAGIAGGTGGSSVRFWAGTGYSNRDNAPFRVHDNGSIVATAGQIGNLRIANGGLSNQDAFGNFIGDAVIVLSNGSTEARIGTQVFSPTTGITAASYFKASSSGYAIYSDSGICRFQETLIQGKKAYISTNAGQRDFVNPSLYDLAIIYGTKVGSTAPSVEITAPTSPINNGKTIQIFQQNGGTSLYLADTLRGYSQVEIFGGEIVTLMYVDGYWYLAGRYDNDGF